MSSHSETAATLATLFPARFIPAALLVYPSALSPPPQNSSALQFLHQLAQAADEAAVSLASSSILSLYNSESDQFSDLALWLGEGSYGPTSIPNIVAALGLTHSHDKAQPNDLPFKGVLPFAPSSHTDSLDPLVSQLHTLRNLHSFHIELHNEPYVLYFLVGQLADGSNAWGGLVSISVWSDE